MQMGITASIPNSIHQILHRLEQSEHQAYLVGGCVRDILLNMQPRDWDICTDALPEEVFALFPDSLHYGMKHGTVTVRWAGAEAEITTFRSETDYSDHRRPDQVTFIHDLRQDLARRDFTSNAIALGANGQIHDPFGGQRDIKNRVLRAVGDPRKRFHEDALRMLRAFRFSAQLGFQIENNTMLGIQSCASIASILAPERVCSEIEKILLSDRPECIASVVQVGLLKPWGIDELLSDVFFLRAIPADRLQRWMGFSLLVPQYQHAFGSLRLDHQTVLMSEVCHEIQALAPAEELDWKYAVERYGLEAVSRCADVLEDVQLIHSRQALQTIMARGDCLSLRSLAVDGSDLIALGLHGKAVGQALQYALHHVFLAPKDNDKTILLKLLEKEFVSRE